MIRAATLGAPGVRLVPRSTLRSITGVDRDVTAFVGVAPRGPARVRLDNLEPDTDLATWMTSSRVQRSISVAVESWTDYRRRFGGFEGPGLLPYAVAAYFAQGGRRANVVRIVHQFDNPVDDAAGRATAELASTTTSDLPIRLHAADEGSWGNRLRVTLSFATRPLATLTMSADEVLFPVDEPVPGGSLLLARSDGGLNSLRFATNVVIEDDPTRARRFLRATPEAPFGFEPERIDLVTGRIDIVDADPTFARTERHADLGLHADHPRWAARVLLTESSLVHPDPLWASSDIRVTDALLTPDSAKLEGGFDRWQDVVPEDLFDSAWVPGDERPGSGIYCLAEADEIGLVAVPDLYSPMALDPTDDVADPPTTAGPLFGPCPTPGPTTEPAPPPPPGLVGLQLDPAIPVDLRTIGALQDRLVGFADWRGDLTALIDVPPGLTVRRILDWRNRFDSRHVAAYHPWLDVTAPDDGRDRLVRVPPSAFAAGVIADREQRLGIHTGPANQVVLGAVRVAEVVSAEHHDELHPSGINVFVPEWDGIRLTGARTLSRQPTWRQLSVIRLVSVIKLSLMREMAFAVFEPSNEALWRDLRRTIDAFLRRLHDRGAFAGTRPAESYFVRCDRTTMSRNDLDNGRLVCLIGIAPVEPIEYIVLRLEQQGDTSVRIEVTGV